MVGELIIEPEALFRPGGDSAVYLLGPKVDAQILGCKGKAPRAAIAGDMGLIGETRGKTDFRVLTMAVKHS